eukprot:360165-Chlamydomonas_euryale.AAC.2
MEREREAGTAVFACWHATCMFCRMRDRPVWPSRIATPASIQPSPLEQRTIKTKTRRHARLPRSAAEDNTAVRAAARAEPGRGHASLAGLALPSTDRGGQGGEPTHRSTEAVSGAAACSAAAAVAATAAHATGELQH